MRNARENYEACYLMPHPNSFTQTRALMSRLLCQLPKGSQLCPWQEKCPLLLGAQSSAKVCPTSTTLHPDTAHNLQALESRVLNSAMLGSSGQLHGLPPWIKPRLDFTRDHTTAQPFSLSPSCFTLNLTDFSEKPCINKSCAMTTTTLLKALPLRKQN